MRIFISPHQDIRVQGLAKAVKSVVSDTYFWDHTRKPLFDLLVSDKPDVIFYHDATDTNGSIALAKQEYPNIKFVFMQFLPTISPFQPDLTIVMDERLKKDESLFLDYQTSVIDMVSGEKNNRYSAEVLVLTDSVDVQDEFQMLVLRALSNKFQTKIYGNITIPIPNYLGRLKVEDYRHAFASTKVFVGFNKDRLNDASYHNCCPLTFNANSPGKYEFRGANQLMEKCQYFIDNGKQEDLSSLAINSTYNHSVVDIFNKLNYSEAATEAQQICEAQKESLK